MPNLNDLRRQWATEPDVKIRAQLAKRMAELDPNFNLPPSPFRVTDVLKVSGVSDATPLRKGEISESKYNEIKDAAKELWPQGLKFDAAESMVLSVIDLPYDPDDGEAHDTEQQEMYDAISAGVQEACAEIAARYGLAIGQTSGWWGFEKGQAQVFLADSLTFVAQNESGDTKRFSSSPKGFDMACAFATDSSPAKKSHPALLHKADTRKPDYGIAKFLWQEGPRWHEGKKVTVFSLAHHTDKASGGVVWTGLQDGISLTSQQPESADGEKRVTGVVMQAYNKARPPAVLVDWDGDTLKEIVLESKGVEGYDPSEDGHKFISARSPFRKADTRRPNR